MRQLDRKPPGQQQAEGGRHTARGNVNTRTSGSLVTIDVSGLRGIVTALRKASPELSRELRAGLRRGGDIVRDDAKVRAMTGEMPENIAKSIAKSIRTRTAGIRVSVLAGSADATAAAAFEHRGVPGQFRHPLFGNRAYWYNQRAHPYLRPAAEANAPKVADAILKAVGDVIDKVLGEETAE